MKTTQGFVEMAEPKFWNETYIIVSLANLSQLSSNMPSAHLGQFQLSDFIRKTQQTQVIANS